MNADKKQAKGEKDWWGRIVMILDVIWDLFTIPR